MYKISTLLLALALSPMAHADIWHDLANYKMGTDAKAPEEVDALVNQTPFDQRAPVEAKLIAILKSSDSTDEAKWYCCRMLARIGTEQSVPVMAGLLGEARLSHYARLLLENLPESAAAGKALTAALDRAADPLKVGLLGSLGARGEASAVSAITAYASSDNAAVAKAALQALGDIGGEQAHAAILQTRTNAKVQLERASLIQDPGQFYSVATAEGPVSGDYVSHHGKAGWQGAYFANGNWEGEPVLVRMDHTVSQSWKHGSPDPSVPKDNFTVRWTGTLVPPESRSYTFSGDADDVIRVLIDGKEILGRIAGGKIKEVEMALEAGRAYEVVVEFQEGGGEAHLHLDWNCASKAQLQAAEKKIVDLVPVGKQLALIDSPELLSEDVAVKLVMQGGNPSIRSAGFIHLMKTQSPRRLQALDAMLKRPEDDARPAVLRAAMEANDPSMRARLMKQLPQMPPEDQGVVLGLIADLALVDYEDPVVGLLASSEGALRDQVIYTLGIIGGTTSFGPLYKAYQADPSPSITFAMTQLKAPSVDVQLMKTVGEDPSVPKRLSAMTPLMLRNPKGAVELFHKLTQPGQPDDLRKAAYKALETVGTVESGKLFAMRIIQQDDWMRPSQQSLKKLCVRIDKGHDVWRGAFKPALKATQDDAARAALLVIADGAVCNDSKNTLSKTIRDASSPLSRKAALSALTRWPDFAAGQVWHDLMKDGVLVEKELSAAQRSVVRLIERREIRADWKKKLQLAADCAKLSDDAKFKQALLDACKGFSNDQRRQYLSFLADDPGVGEQAKALIK